MKQIVLIYICRSETNISEKESSFLENIDQEIWKTKPYFSSNDFAGVHYFTKNKFNDLVVNEKNYIVNNTPVFLVGYIENGKTFFTNKISEKYHYTRHIVKSIKDLYFKINSGAKLDTGKIEEYNESKEGNAENKDGSVLVDSGKYNLPLPDVAINAIESLKDIIDDALDAVCVALPAPLNEVCSFKKWLYLAGAVGAAYKANESKTTLGRNAYVGLGLFSLAAWQIQRSKEEEQPKTSGIGKIQKSKWQPVYSQMPVGRKQGVSTFANLRNESGVYLIKENGVIVYIGMAIKTLYKTAIRHFQKWNDSAQRTRISYKKHLNSRKYEIRFILTSDTQAENMESYLIKLYDNPRDNKFVPYAYRNSEPAMEKAYKNAEIIETVDYSDVPF